ncbi:MAG TPA: LPS export ABC transporter periplasmic protein LptC [Bacillota bacterium]|nr:LPS export ABC transporter periplasmic protein LptC [Bacillota bacterium]HPT86515.1 LPS export ABC transporter periplasmic protein LptC [Bacillota bacterium]
MKRLVIPIIWILATTLVAVLGHYGGWWEEPPTSDPVAKPQPVAPDMIIRQSKLVGWDGSQKTWEVKAERIWQTNGGNQIYFENISEGIIFSLEGKEVAFQSKWARWEKFFKSLYIGGNLQARVEDKILTTEEVVMRYDTEIIHSSRPVTVTGKNLKMTAGSMQLDLKNEMLILDNGVELEQNGDSLRSKGVRYNLKTEEFELVEPEGVVLSL